MERCDLKYISIYLDEFQIVTKFQQALERVSQLFINIKFPMNRWGGALDMGKEVRFFFFFAILAKLSIEYDKLVFCTN